MNGTAGVNGSAGASSSLSNRSDGAAANGSVGAASFQQEISVPSMSNYSVPSMSNYSRYVSAGPVAVHVRDAPVVRSIVRPEVSRCSRTRTCTRGCMCLDVHVDVRVCVRSLLGPMLPYTFLTNTMCRVACAQVCADPGQGASFVQEGRQEGRRARLRHARVRATPARPDATARHARACRAAPPRARAATCARARASSASRASSSTRACRSATPPFRSPRQASSTPPSRARAQ